jgi:DNA-binding transcriptional regulator YdaS (Cro superfamily)
MVLDADAVRSLLRVAIELEGGQGAFARRHGLQRSNLNGILNGKRPVSVSVVKALGLRRAYIAAQDGE